MIRPGFICNLLLASASLLACSVASAGDLLDLRRVAASSGDAVAGKAKAAICSACHGPLGLSPVPLFPNLAGQKADYLYWRLVAFKRANNPASAMTAQVANLDDATMHDLAAWFASLPAAAPAAVAGNERIARGESLYLEGDPGRGIPPCQGCHGVTATGHPLAHEDASRRVYPALRNQHAAYLIHRLEDLAAETDVHTSTVKIMAPIARTLDPDAIAALAAWLESGAP
ncbi:c-type cytochrome [Dokdonella sp.]|uniref:c-type cytochrome n=1 Tax=Dokdonella sp. TaxID=2291710 RepID=UPI0037836FFC